MLLLLSRRNAARIVMKNVSSTKIISDCGRQLNDDKKTFVHATDSGMNWL